MIFCIAYVGKLVHGEPIPHFHRYSSTKAFCLGFCATFFSAFDVPVFWPILLLYWLVLFFLTMKRQIRHMIKHRYVPFSIGKQVRLDIAGEDMCSALHAHVQ